MEFIIVVFTDWFASTKINFFLDFNDYSLSEVISYTHVLNHNHVTFCFWKEQAFPTPATYCLERIMVWELPF